MENNMSAISNVLSYRSKLNCHSIDSYNNAIDSYNHFVKKVEKDKAEFIIVDTNVLLRYYEVANSDRKELLSFFEKNKKKIYIPHKVQIEFLRNRESIIKRFAENITHDLITSLDSKIIEPLNTYLKTYKNILIEYENFDLEKTILAQIKNIETLKSKLHDPIKKRKEKYTDIIHNDKFLTTLVSCNKLPALSEDELNLIKEDFIHLRDEEYKLDAKNLTDFVKKNPEKVFPGIGDIKEKSENPFGDFIIYHEMIKCMSDKKTDCLFLTFDTSKGDWMKMTKFPHTQYIINAFENTSKSLCIYDAEKYLNQYANKNIVTPVFDPFIKDLFEKQRDLETMELEMRKMKLMEMKLQNRKFLEIEMRNREAMERELRNRKLLKIKRLEDVDMDIDIDLEMEMRSIEAAEMERRRIEEMEIEMERKKIEEMERRNTDMMEMEIRKIEKRLKRE